MGLVFQPPLSSHEIVSRTHVGMGDVVLALAAGAAGALSITTGASSALIGVMVAVALLPSTVVTGMLVGEGQWGKAIGAAELLAVNLLSLNLAAIVTFLARGIRPGTWWEAEYAKRASRQALIAGGAAAGGADCAGAATGERVRQYTRQAIQVSERVQD